MENVRGRLLENKVLVIATEAESKTAGGLIIPDSAKEKLHTGVVVKIGPGLTDVPMTVKEEDEILYGKYTGNEAVIDGKEFLLMRETDVLYILND